MLIFMSILKKLTTGFAALVVLVGCAGGVKKSADKDTLTPSGLKYHDIVVGKGAMPETGQICVVHYTGWLADGTIFGSSVNRKQPFTFAVGRGMVIKGWDEGVSTMRVGGKRRLTLPPNLAYGSQGAGGSIPPNATLTFEVELLDIR